MTAGALARLGAGIVLLWAAFGCGTGDTTPAATRSEGIVVSGLSDQGAFAGAEPGSPYEMPDVTLEDTNGQPFDLVSDTAYPVTLVFFGYTNCPDVCPLVMSDLTSAVVQLPSEVRAKTQVLFITTDPARDTPEVLRRYLDTYDKDFVGLTGDLRAITAVAAAMGVAVEGRQRLPSGGYEVGHGAQVIGFNGDEAPVLWTVGTPVSDMAGDIVALAAL